MVLNPCIVGSLPTGRVIFFILFCIYLFYFFFFLIFSFFCNYYFSANSTLLSLLRFSYFVTSYDAQASSAFSALILFGSIFSKTARITKSRRILSTLLSSAVNVIFSPYSDIIILNRISTIGPHDQQRHCSTSLK